MGSDEGGLEGGDEPSGMWAPLPRMVAMESARWSRILERWEVVRVVSLSRNFPTSAAQCANPARNLVAESTGGWRCREDSWRWSVCTWRTVISRISAFSSLLYLDGCKEKEKFVKILL